MNKQKSMTVGSLLKRLSAIAKKHGTKARVLFDTEAGSFDCHCVDIRNAHYLSEKLMGIPASVVLTTNYCIRHGKNNESISMATVDKIKQAIRNACTGFVKTKINDSTLSEIKLKTEEVLTKFVVMNSLPIEIDVSLDKDDPTTVIITPLNKHTAELMGVHFAG